MSPLPSIAVLLPLLGAGLIACHPGGSGSGGTSAPAVPLVATEWTLVELAGKPAPLGAGGRPATLVLAGADGRASGFAGCNRFMGSYQTAGKDLTIGPVAMTRMACDRGMELEQQYGAALAAVRHYRVAGKSLELSGDQGAVARLTAP